MTQLRRLLFGCLLLPVMLQGVERTIWEPGEAAREALSVWSLPTARVHVHTEWRPDGLAVSFQSNPEGSSDVGKVSTVKDLIPAIIAEAAQEGLDPHELYVRLEYPRDDYKKAWFLSFYSNGQYTTDMFSLRQGEHDYLLSNASRGSTGKSLNGLALVQFRPTQAEGYTLKKIWLTFQPSNRSTSRTLDIVKVKRWAEVCAGTPTVLDSFYRRPELALTAPPDCPVKATLSFDDQAFRLDVESVFPQPPAAIFTGRDQPVWQDEALEFFLSPWNDNQSFFQFAINAQGGIWDMAQEYDETACQVKGRSVVDLEHEKVLSYQDGVQRFQLTFPWKSFRSQPPPQTRLVGFLLVQNYRSVSYCWEKGQRNTHVANHGFLVFNQQPFGTGSCALQKAEMREPQDELTFTYELKDFAPGTYQAELHLVAPDYSIARHSSQIQLSGGTETVPLLLKNAKNINGRYTITLMLHNSAGAIRADACDLINVKKVQFPFGQDVIYPQPKKVEWREGVFPAATGTHLQIAADASARTRRTAELFLEKLNGFAGTDRYRITAEDGPGIRLSLDPSAGPEEGYTLEVRPEGAEIRGGGEPGLFYGTVTFLHLLKLRMRRQDQAPVPCCRIVDWPDLARRAPHLWHSDLLNMPFLEKSSLAFLLDYLDIFAVGNKANVLKIRGLETFTWFEKTPEVNSRNTASRYFTLDDWRRLAEFCRDRFIDLMITLPAGGHDYWLTYGQKDLRETAWDTGDVSNPEYQRLYFSCAAELIEATGCRYFTPEGDEWWHNRQKDVPEEETIRGKTRAQVFLDFQLRLHAFLKERGVRMAMFTDMLDPLHNGGRYEVHTIIDSLPRDIILLVWSNTGRNFRYFGEKGFELWGCNTSWWTVGNPEERPYVSGWGASAYSYGREHAFRTSTNFSFHNAWFMGGNYGWNFKSETLNFDLADNINSGVLTAAQCMFAERPCAYASEEVRVIDIARYFNAELPEVPAVKRQRAFGNILMQTRRQNNQNAVLVDKLHSPDLPVKGKYSTLIFLHTARENPEYRKASGFNNRQWQLGYPIADYIVIYDDNSAEVVPIRLNLHCYWYDWQPQAGSTVFGRYMEILYDQDKKPHFLYQYEWINPHPQKTIRSIRLTNPYSDFQGYLCALSGRLLRE